MHADWIGVISNVSSSFCADVQVWNSTSLKNDYFSRGNVDLLKTGSSFLGIKIDVTSNNCNPKCADITVTPPVAMPFVV